MGACVEPCNTPTSFVISMTTSPTGTLIPIDGECVAATKFTNFEGIPSFLSTAHIPSLGTESKALTRSMNAVCVSTLCSIHF